MISNEKIKLLEVWKKNPFDEFSISEIMNLAKKRTKTWVFNALKLFVKYKILKAKRKGNLDIYSLNASNPVSMQFLQFLDTQANIGFDNIELISEIIQAMPIKNYCLIVFGSHAEGKEEKNSDIDICILLENNDLEKMIKPHMNDIKMNYTVKIDDHYITFGDFTKMLLRKDENLGKQIFRKHKLFYNADIYYRLIKEAYENGFRP